jgi:hypothetical protein
MNEDAVRAIVRDVLARHLSAVPEGPPGAAQVPTPLAWHASHARYGVLSGEDADGPCLIEPSVRCNHCGYCQSHGH